MDYFTIKSGNEGYPISWGILAYTFISLFCHLAYIQSYRMDIEAWIAKYKGYQAVKSDMDQRENKGPGYWHLPYRVTVSKGLSYVLMIQAIVYGSLFYDVALSYEDEPVIISGLSTLSFLNVLLSFIVIFSRGTRSYLDNIMGILLGMIMIVLLVSRLFIFFYAFIETLLIEAFIGYEEGLYIRISSHEIAIDILSNFLLIWMTIRHVNGYNLSMREIGLIHARRDNTIRTTVAEANV